MKTDTLKRVQAASNPYMGLSVAEMKRKYDTEIRGKKLSAKELSVIANQMQAAKKATLKSKPKPSTPTPKTTSSTPKTKPAATTKSQASNKAVEGGSTISQKNRQPKQSKPSRRRGSGVQNGRNRTKNQMKIVKKALSGLTHKKGDTKKVNGITYVHNGKRFVRYTM